MPFIQDDQFKKQYKYIEHAENGCFLFINYQDFKEMIPNVIYTALTLCSMAVTVAVRWPDPDKDQLVYIQNPIEAEMPGHWVPLSIVKVILEKKSLIPKTIKSSINLQLTPSKYIKSEPKKPDWKDVWKDDWKGNGKYLNKSVVSKPKKPHTIIKPHNNPSYLPYAVDSAVKSKHQKYSNNGYNGKSEKIIKNGGSNYKKKNGDSNGKTKNDDRNDKKKNGVSNDKKENGDSNDKIGDNNDKNGDNNDKNGDSDDNFSYSENNDEEDNSDSSDNDNNSDSNEENDDSGGNVSSSDNTVTEESHESYDTDSNVDSNSYENKQNTNENDGNDENISKSDNNDGNSDGNDYNNDNIQKDFDSDNGIDNANENGIDNDTETGIDNKDIQSNNQDTLENIPTTTKKPKKKKKIKNIHGNYA